MRYSLCALALLITFTNVAKAARVKALTKLDPRVIGISHTPDDKVAIDARYCIYKVGTNSACGKIIRKEKTWAILYLDQVASDIQVGDWVAAARATRGVSSISNEPPMYWGFDIGLTMASASSLSTSNFSSRTAGQLRATIEGHFAKHFLYGLGLGYAEKGPKISSGSSEALYRLDYLELPVWVKAKLLNGKIHPYFTLGATVGFLVNAKVDTTVAGTTTRMDVKNQLTSSHFAIEKGAGVEAELTDSMSVHAGIIYSYGLTDISGGVKLQNLTFTSGLGFVF